ncbi:MAG: hypothetical protein AAGF31_13570 [Planctomycetota bacterium]
MEFSFGCDNGELDSLSSAECFVLGFEFCLVYEAVKHGRGFDGPVKAENRDRIERLCKKFEALYHLQWSHEDSSESWLHLVVAAEERK